MIALEQFPKCLSVIAGLVPAISITGARAILIEMAGTGPAMTTRGVDLIGKRANQSNPHRRVPAIKF
jgi:hypothetical protein